MNKLTDIQTALIEENIQFAYYKSNQWFKLLDGNIDREELDSICRFALTKAAASYKSDKANFATYASKCIDNEVLKNVNEAKNYLLAVDRLTPDSDEEAQQEDVMLEDLKFALSTLPQLTLQVIELFYSGSATKAEIARKHKITVQQVNDILKETKKFVREYMG